MTEKPQQSNHWPLSDVQRVIHEMYQEKDGVRGTEPTFLWFVAEVGELAEAVRVGSSQDRHGEFADVLAWLATLANLCNVDLTKAFHEKYGQGCPGCRQMKCVCPTETKP